MISNRGKNDVGDFLDRGLEVRCAGENATNGEILLHESLELL
jgi:hypothetical protein